MGFRSVNLGLDSGLVFVLRQAMKQELHGKVGTVGWFHIPKNHDHHAWVHIGNVVESKMTPPNYSSFTRSEWHKMGENGINHPQLEADCSQASLGALAGPK